jgi:hypothetical protein
MRKTRRDRYNEKIANGEVKHYPFSLCAVNFQCDENEAKCGDGITIDALGNIIIYDPEYDVKTKPVYYQSPNIIVPNPKANDNIQQNNLIIIPKGSSSPAYQS